ncbi:MAG: AMP-binding protein [Chitinophagales bacterium]|nr:AMP-binding protein [Chitinophagales bacterium]
MNYTQPQLEFQSPAEIKKYQDLALQQALQYLAAQSPYYKKLFTENNIRIESIKSITDLTQIPTTTKDDFSLHNFDFLCVPKSTITDYTTTSGTTGSPVTVALTENDLQRLAYNEERSFVCANGTASDVYQLMLTLDRQFMAGMAYYLGIRKMGAGAVRVGPVSPQMQWENILRFQPTALVVVPSFLLKLIDYADANSINYNNSSIKKAVCIGEPIHHADLSENILAKRIHEKWNLPLFSTYASTEMQTAFTECEHGCGGHHRPELLIVEILDEAGNQLKAGEFGEVTITSLGVEGMPLLRYRTGDICCYYEEPCKCGRNTIRLSPVTGRKNQMIKYKGTTLFPPAIYEAISHVPEVKDYVVEVSKNVLGTDEIVLHLSVSGSPDAIEPKIKTALQTKLRVIPAINFVTTAHLQSLRPAESRKPVMIVFKPV